MTAQDLQAAAIILAAGTGERLGGGAPKAFLSIGGSSMLEVSLRSAGACPSVSLLVAVVPEGFEAAIGSLPDLGAPVTAVVGGDSRQASVAAGLEACGDAALVLCHDAARPFATSSLYDRVIRALEDRGADAVVPVVAIADTVKRVKDDVVTATEPRDELMLAQTPQGFRTEQLRAAHGRAKDDGRSFTDDAALMEWMGATVVTVPGEPDNLKITTPIDLARAEAIIRTGGALR